MDLEAEAYAKHANAILALEAIAVSDLPHLRRLRILFLDRQRPISGVPGTDTGHYCLPYLLSKLRPGLQEGESGLPEWSGFGSSQTHHLIGSRLSQL